MKAERDGSLSKSEVENRFIGDSFLQDKLRVDYHDIKDQSVFESMQREINEWNLLSFDLPLHTAFFSLKIGEGEDWGQAFLSLSDLYHLDSEQTYLKSFVSFKTCLFFAHLYLQSGKKYITQADYWH